MNINDKKHTHDTDFLIARILDCYDDFGDFELGELLLMDSNKTDKSALYIINYLMTELRKIVKNSRKYRNSIYYRNKNLATSINKKLEKLEREKNIPSIDTFQFLLKAMDFVDNGENQTSNEAEAMKIFISNENNMDVVQTQQDDKRKRKIKQFELTQEQKRTEYARKTIKADEENVEVKESEFLKNQNIYGALGLYVKKNFYPGNRICSYFGEMVRTEDVRKPEYKSDYLIELGDDENGVSMTVDASSSYVHSGYGKYINDPIFEDQINCRIDVYTNQNDNESYLGVYATRKVKKGEELLCNYGLEYWQEEHFYRLDLKLQHEINIQRAKKKLAEIPVSIDLTKDDS